MFIQSIIFILYYIIVIGTSIYLILYLYSKYCFSYWKKRNVPTLKPIFPYGNCELVIKPKMSLGLYLVHYYNAMKAHGCKYAGLYFFHVPYFLPICPDLIKNIMTRDFPHFVNRDIYHDENFDPLSAHLFSINDDKWRFLKHKTSPIFTVSRTKKMFQTLYDCSLELKNCLDDKLDTNEPIDIKHTFMQYATNVIGSYAFGIECNSFQNSNSEFIRFSSKIFSPEGTDRLRIFIAFALPKLAKFFQIPITNKEVDKFYRNLVRETVEYREKNNISRNDVLQLLIQFKNNTFQDDADPELDKSDEDIKSKFNRALTFNEIAAQAYMFFLAGFETTSTTGTFCLFELSQNQQIQDKVRAEVFSVLKKYNGQITFEALNEMHYMELTLEETLRKFSPVMSVQRKVTSDYIIPNTNIVLEKGTIVMIPIYALHCDPQYYPEPERFDPNRFTKENKASRPDYTWLPFGEGPRKCTGVKFAMIQVKLALTQLLLRYKFKLHQKTKLPIEFEPRALATTTVDTIYLSVESVN